MAIVGLGGITGTTLRDISKEIENLYSLNFEKVVVDLTGCNNVIDEEVKALEQFRLRNVDKPFCFFGATRNFRDLLIAIFNMPRSIFFETSDSAFRSEIFQRTVPGIPDKV